MKNKVSLVGAGPGALDLITLRGLRCIQNARVVLYDALVNEGFLEFCKQDCIKVFVGKRSGSHSIPQEEINQLLLKWALSHHEVVRLKGGDPVVFGRAFEELEYLQKHGVEVELVSGVSSCIAVPTAVGIPVTKRGVSQSFWVITGHTRSGNISNDIFLAAKSNATVVVLMGLSSLGKISKIFCEAGKSHVPVAIIQNGTNENQNFIVAVMSDIVSKVSESNIKQPSVIVIGDVVGLCPDYIKEYGVKMLD